MIPYGCLATGQNVGMIEVVRNAKTVMHILKQDIRSAMMVRTKELHSWIREKNRSLSSAVDKTGTSSEGYLLFHKNFIVIFKKNYFVAFCACRFCPVDMKTVLYILLFTWYILSKRI